jgi:heterodisulfide reductase subunit A
MDERAFNKEYSKYHAGAREQYNIEYHRCRVSAVYEDPETKDLILRYAHISGRISKERYELVVLANGVEPPANAPHLAEVFGFELNRHGFCRTNKFTPLQTSRPGVFVCGTFAAPKEISETILDASGAAAEIIRFLNHRINTNPHSKVWPFRASVSGRLLQLEDIDHRPPRTGVFLCSCGGTIGKVIDLEALRDKAVRMPAVAQAEIIEFACLPEGRARIQDEIKRHSLNRVVVAACSARTHQALFQRTVVQSGLNPYLLETSNLREQCAQVHQGEPERAARKAGEMLRVAVARVAIAQPIHKLRAPCLSSALVIGGGVAGMTAALAIADSGYDVHLVEREDVLGGNLRDLSYVAEGSDPQKLLRDLLTRIRSHQKIKTYTRAKVIGHSGQVGRFRTELVIRLADGTSTHTTLEHAVTVIATGARESRNHPLLQHPGIMTQRQLEETIVRHPEKTDALREVVMIQCVRPEGTPPYCSRLCCTNALKNAVRLKLLNPSCRVTVLYKDIVAYGFREEFYTNAREHGVVFIRYTDECPPRVSTEGNRLSVIARDLALNRELVLPADVVALSMAITTGPETVELARTLGVPLSAEGFFAEAQLKLRPMDFTREGVFLAGMAQYPKFLEESISHALAAAGRAISILSQDSVHLGPIVARVDSGKCVGCLTCVRVCPFGAPRVVAEEGRTGVGGLGGAAFIDPTLCQGCGTCTAECPANAIELDNFSDQQVMLPHINGLGTWQ